MGIEIAKIEIRYEHLSVEGDVHVGIRALPTLINSTMNAIEVISENSSIFIFTCLVNEISINYVFQVSLLIKSFTSVNVHASILTFNDVLIWFINVTD